MWGGVGGGAGGWVGGWGRGMGCRAGDGGKGPDTDIYVPNTYTHPSPKPFHPWAQTLSYTHPHTPFTHGPDTDIYP